MPTFQELIINNNGVLGSNGMPIDKAAEVTYCLDGPVLTIEEQTNHSDLLVFKNLSGVTVCRVAAAGNLTCHDITANDISAHSMSLTGNMSAATLIVDSAIAGTLSAGLKLGGSGEKISFYGGTPVVKPAVGANVSTGVVSGTAGLLFTVLEQGLINALVTKINEHSTAINKLQNELKNLGLVQT